MVIPVVNRANRPTNGVPNPVRNTNETPRVEILGVSVDAINMSTAVEIIEQWIETGQRQYVAVCAVNNILEASDDPAYRAVLESAGLRVSDGMPLVWLSHRAGQCQTGRVRGADLVAAICARSGQTGHRHYFYGGGPGVANKLVERMSAQAPGLQVAGVYTPGEMEIGEFERQDIISAVNDAQPDIIWVGLGSPKQEWWVANHRPLLEAPVIIAVGAAFDFHSGRVRQAPKWVQAYGFEWLYRLGQDPRRLWKRYLIGNPRFLLRLVLD